MGVCCWSTMRSLIRKGSHRSRLHTQQWLRPLNRRHPLQPGCSTTSPTLPVSHQHCGHTHFQNIIAGSPSPCSHPQLIHQGWATQIKPSPPLSFLGLFFRLDLWLQLFPGEILFQPEKYPWEWELMDHRSWICFKHEGILLQFPLVIWIKRW